jgi:hypothetical protein
MPIITLKLLRLNSGNRMYSRTFDCHLLFGEVKDLLNRFREEVIQNNIEPLADKSDVFDLARQDYLDLIKRLDGLARPLPRTRV